MVDRIGIFLDTKETRDDLWKEQEDFATRFRKEHPIRFFFLTKTFLGNIKPEHHFFKGLLLEDEEMLKKATRRIYTKDYLVGYEKTEQALNEVEKDNPLVILEIACGRGSFFKPFLQSRHGKGVYIATDFSPTVLRSNQKWLRKNELEEQVTLMALDAKATPFRDNTIPAAVSNIGFLNIRNNGKAVTEAFRLLAPSGILIANFMFTIEKTENYTKAKEMGLHQFYTRKNVEEVFQKVGFEFHLEELYQGSVRPTPGGIDTLPIVQDRYSFCVLIAKKPEQ